MTTDPGDLVLDPTCGSGTTAYVAEQWGRRWITVRHQPRAAGPGAAAAPDGHLRLVRVEGRARAARPAASSTSASRTRRARKSAASSRTSRSKSIANNEPPAEEVLVDRPETVKRHHPRDRAVRVRGHHPHARWMSRQGAGSGAGSTAVARSPGGRGTNVCRPHAGNPAQDRRSCSWAATRRSRSRTSARRPRRSRFPRRRWSRQRQKPSP